MSISTFIRHSTFALGTLSLFGLGNLAVSPAQAATMNALVNGGFEAGFAGWMTSGDASIQGLFQGFPPVVPPSGMSSSNQALLTTASVTNPDDDNGTDTVPAGQYNFSGTTATNAEFSGYQLQNFLGLSPTALNIVGNVTGEIQSPSEGSAIKQQFVWGDDPMEAGPLWITFNWRFLTNDGNSVDGNLRDTAFVSIYNVSSPVASRTIIPLTRSSGPITSPPTNWQMSEFQTTNPATPGFNTFDSRNSIGLLPAGTYVIAIGVYDVDGTDKTSAILVDNVEAIPEPLTMLGAATAAGFGTFFKRQVAKKKKDEKEPAQV